MREAIRSYKDLVVWQQAVDLALDIYRISDKFPDHEKFGISNQLRRASISISSNIAEGWGRNSTKNYIQFLRISRGSLLEIESIIHVTQKLNYISESDHDAISSRIEAISKMLNRLISTLENKLNAKPDQPHSPVPSA